MTTGVQTVIYPVRDLEKAKQIFGRLLGVEPEMDEVYYVGYRVAGQEIGLNPQGHATGMTGPLAYWHVPDIEATFQSLLDAGAVEKEAIHSVGGTRRIGAVTDPDGNVIGLLQDG